MSDDPLSSDWWLAADGKYYAPDVDPLSIGATGPIDLRTAESRARRARRAHPALGTRQSPNPAATLVRARELAAAELQTTPTTVLPDPFPHADWTPIPAVVDLTDAGTSWAKPTVTVPEIQISTEPDLFEHDLFEDAGIEDAGVGTNVEGTGGTDLEDGIEILEDEIAEPEVIEPEIIDLEPEPLSTPPIDVNPSSSGTAPASGIRNAQRRYKSELTQARQRIKDGHATVVAAHQGPSIDAGTLRGRGIIVRQWTLSVEGQSHDIAGAFAAVEHSGNDDRPVGLVLRLADGTRYQRTFKMSEQLAAEEVARTILDAARAAEANQSHRHELLDQAVTEFNETVAGNHNLNRAEMELAALLGVDVHRQEHRHWSAEHILESSPNQLAKEAFGLRLSGRPTGGRLPSTDLYDAPKVSPRQKTERGPWQTPLMPIWGWAAAAILVAIVVVANLGVRNAPSLGQPSDSTETPGVTDTVNPDPTQANEAQPEPTEVTSNEAATPGGEFRLELPEAQIPPTEEVLPALSMSAWLETDPGIAFVNWDAFVDTRLAIMIDHATTGTADNMMAACNLAQTDYDPAWTEAIAAIPDEAIRSSAQLTNTALGNALNLCSAGDIGPATNNLFATDTALTDTQALVTGSISN